MESLGRVSPSAQDLPEITRKRRNAISEGKFPELPEKPEIPLASRKIGPITDLAGDLRNKILFRGSLESSFRALSYLAPWQPRSSEIGVIYQSLAQYDKATSTEEKSKIIHRIKEQISVWEVGKGGKLAQAASKPAVDALKTVLDEIDQLPSVQSEVTGLSAAPTLDEARKLVMDMDRMDLKASEKAIAHVRTAFKAVVSQSSASVIPELQELNTTMMKKYFEKLSLVAQAHLDKPMPEGCKFTFLLLGSAAIGTTSPMSDIDFAVVCEKPEHKSYLSELVKKMHALNNKEAFPLCDQVTPQGGFVGKYLLGTAQEFSKWQETANSKSGDMRLRDAMEAVSVRVAAGGNDLTLTDAIQAPTSQKQMAVKKLQSVVEFTRPGGARFDVKLELIRAPTLFIEGLCLYHDIGTKESNIWNKLDVLEKEKKITPEQAGKIRNLLQFAYQVRYASHLKSGQEQDTVFVTRPDYKADNYLVLSDQKIFGSESEVKSRMVGMVRTIEVLKVACRGIKA
jgi:hypothetical protein